MDTNDWFAPLEMIVSKGRMVDRPGSLAGLAAARREHLGQFFTPCDVANVMWRIACTAMDRYENDFPDEHHKFSLFDNSVGSGRLFQFADPKRHKLHGIDVDPECINALSLHAVNAGFDADFVHTGLEATKPRLMDIALINPPFSVHLESPHLKPFKCTAYGKFGPHTSALSHIYAVAQAIEASKAVIALVPYSFATAVSSDRSALLDANHANRLCHVLHLPNGVFREEGTDVRVSILIFSNTRCRSFGITEMKALSDELPPLQSLRINDTIGKGDIRALGLEDRDPYITLPVTGNNQVDILHDGRKIKLRFHCGLVQAKVENATLQRRIYSSKEAGIRLPREVHYMGQGKYDIEVYLAQQDPQEALNSFFDLIRSVGGKPSPTNGFMSYFRRRMSQHARAAEPFSHNAFIDTGSLGAGDEFIGEAIKTFAIDRTSWSSPVIKKGDKVSIERRQSAFSCQVGDQQYLLDSTDVAEHFHITSGQANDGWQELYEGLLQCFPSEATMMRKRAVQAGIDKWLNWDFQLDDLIELCLKPHGAIAAWEMGLGKARLAIALLLLSGCKRGLIVTEAGLIEEMLIELRGLPIHHNSWQVISSMNDLTSLRRINIISYERLRLPVSNTKRVFPGGAVKRAHQTFAGKLRRRIGVIVCDEGDALANPDSDQSRAVWQVSAKRRYVLTGTPIANYPRDILPILAFSSGDGTAAQPWGWHRGSLAPFWLESMEYAARGIDAFRESFVSLEWVTREFEDTMTSGAKREIPRIKNIEAYRKMIAPHVKRRLECEPAAQKWISTPKPFIEVVNVPWDSAHLSFYLKVCDEFREWYRNVNGGSRGGNLVTILAHLRAVSFAQDFPQYGVPGLGSYNQLTSKQRWLIDEIESLTNAGRKTVIYLENPGLVELLGKALTERNIEYVPFHGGIPIKKRTRMLDELYRHGPIPNLVATLGVTQKGLNIPQANEGIFACRSWSASVEAQAAKRLLRPQQKQQVRIRFIHLPGGIDIYKAQLVDFKRDAASAGLDWGNSDCDDKEFLHLETIVARFVKDTARLHDLKPFELRDFLNNMTYEKEFQHAA